MRLLIDRILTIILLLFLAQGIAVGQQPTPLAPAVPALAAEPDRPAVPMVWGVAILGTLLILTIVCAPSRKA